MLRPSRPMILPFISSFGRLDQLGRRSHRVLPGKPLRRGGEDAARTPLGLLARLLLDLAQSQASLAPCVGLDFVEKHLARFAGAQRGDPFQLGTLQLTKLCVQRLQPVQNQIGLRTVAA